MNFEKSFEPLPNKHRPSVEKQASIEAYRDAIRNKDWDLVEKLRDGLVDTGLFGNTYRQFVALAAIDIYMAKYGKVNVDDVVEILRTT